jgi:hypothetical protein
MLNEKVNIQYGSLVLLFATHLLVTDSLPLL